MSQQVFQAWGELFELESSTSPLPCPAPTQHQQPTPSSLTLSAQQLPNPCCGMT
jgi:hypothetical protein